MKNQTRILPGTENGERIRISSNLVAPSDGQEKLENWLIQSGKDESIKTHYDLFQNAIKKFPNNNFLGDRKNSENGEFVWKSYEEVGKLAEKLGSALIDQLGVEKGNVNCRIGIYAGNCWEWTVNGLAANTYSYVMVPMYDTLGDQAMRYVTDQCGFDTVLIDKDVKVQKFIKSVQAHEDGRKVKNLVCFDKPSQTSLDLAAQNDVNLVWQQDLLDKQGDKILDHCPPKPEDTFCICYTSGTTGNPKGVVQTHASWLADFFGVELFLPDANESDSWLSYLPSAHVFERMCQTLMISCGGSIGYFGGDPKNLIADAAALKPTFFGGVPRVWNKIYAKLENAKKESFIKNWLISKAQASKVSQVKNGVCQKGTLWDKLVFGKIQALLGGRVRVGVCGAAPIKNEVMNTLRAALGCYIVEAYGQTECSAGACATLWGDPEPSVGSPLGSCAIKLASVEEMNYHSRNDQGEICIKGPILMKEYLNNPEKTAETIDKDGWLHTGDVGEWTKNGTLKIIDRAKHIFKTSLGEYIAPEKIENIYALHEAVGQIFVYGDSLKNTLVAIVIPPMDQPGVFQKWAGEAEDTPIEGILNDERMNMDLNKKLLKELDVLGRKSGLKGFESIKALTFVPELMSVDLDLLTPTLKTKRPNCKKYYQDKIDKMYQNLD